MAAPNPPHGCDYGIWLTSPSVSGGKSWIGFRNFDTIEVHWGKTNHINQRKTFALGRSFPRTILADMVKKKIAKGYQVVREWDPKNGWQGTGTLRTGSRHQPLPSPPELPIQHFEPSPKGFNRLTVAQAVDVWLNSPPNSSTVNGSTDEWF